MTAETGYSEVGGIAAHVENDIVRIQVEDAAHSVRDVPFRRETDGIPWCEVLRDVHFSILVNSAVIVDTEIIGMLVTAHTFSAGRFIK